MVYLLNGDGEIQQRSQNEPKQRQLRFHHAPDKYWSAEVKQRAPRHDEAVDPQQPEQPLSPSAVSVAHCSVEEDDGSVVPWYKKWQGKKHVAWAAYQKRPGRKDEEEKVKDTKQHVRRISVPLTSGGNKGRYAVPASFGLPFDAGAKRTLNPLVGEKSVNVEGVLDVDATPADGSGHVPPEADSAPHKASVEVEDEEWDDDANFEIKEMSLLDNFCNFHALGCYAFLIMVLVVCLTWYLVSENENADSRNTAPTPAPAPIIPPASPTPPPP